MGAVALKCLPVQVVDMGGPSRLIATEMPWVSKQSSHRSSMRTPLVVTAIGMAQPVRAVMAAHASAKCVEVIDAPRQRFSTMKDNGEIGEGRVRRHALLCAATVPQHLRAHQLGLLVDGGVAKPVTIGAVDIAARGNLDQ